MGNQTVPMAWDRRFNETEQAFEAFRAFVDSGSKRSITGTGRILGKHRSQMQEWSKVHDWKSRAIAYDLVMEQSARSARNKEVIKLQQVIIDDAAYDYHLLLSRWRNAAQNDELSLSELEQLIRVRDMIDKLGRRVAELPTTYKVMGNKKDTAERPSEKQLTWGTSEALPMIVDGNTIDEGENEQDSDTDND